MLEVIPRGPYSIAAVAERASTPAFATAAWACSGMPVKWNVAEMKIMRPPVEGLVPVFGFAAADFMRWGRVALRVLNEPRVSISKTVLNAFEDRPEIGATKFPAAPALEGLCQYLFFRLQWDRWILHDEVDASQLFDTCLNRSLQILNSPHVYGTNSNYFRS